MAQGVNNRNIGRPSLGDKKLPQRTIMSDWEIEQFLKENPGVNASIIFRRAAHSIMPKDADTIRLQKLAQEISDERAVLAIKEAEYNSLKARIEDRERIQLELRLEKDYHAWYFRSLVHAEIFSIQHMPAVSPDSIVREYLRERIQSYEVMETETGWKLTDRATGATKRLLRHFIGEGGNLIPAEGKTFLAPTEEGLYSMYSLRIDYKLFEAEFLKNPRMEDMPLEFFRRFSPVIRANTTEKEESIKREVKQKMMPSYVSPPEVSTEEAKNRIEKPWGERQ
ncbi:MAG: hypothetical protein M1476_05385 [Candidatus Thermoplasmatota archaeon]|nr:hypothetical protein [Candidatus Thermoplasmatota archaeon]